MSCGSPSLPHMGPDLVISAHQGQEGRTRGELRLLSSPERFKDR